MEEKKEIVLLVDHVDLDLLRAALRREIQNARLQAVWYRGWGASSEEAERFEKLLEQLGDS